MKLKELKPLDLQLFAEEEKTEEATPKRRREARQEGQVAKSADVSAAAVLAVLIIFLFFFREYFVTSFYQFNSYLWSDILGWELTPQNLKFIVEDTIVFFFKIMLPVLLLALAVGVAVNLAQVGFLFTTKVIEPKLEKIDPLKGLKRMFSVRALMELFKSMVKIVAVGAVAYFIVRSQLSSLLGLLQLEIWQGFSFVADLIFKVAAGVLVIFVLLAVADYIFQRYQFNKSIRMSKYEVKQEMKQTEGDPQLKSKLKERQRQMARQRMMQSVPEATVVITNPTHLAVALKYDTDNAVGAPEVVAKGAGTLAERIKAVAQEHNVPTLENKTLAQALYQNVEVGQEIPVELYQAVAEVLAFVYRMGKRG